MADTIDKIPNDARWAIATKGLTGAYTAISNALRQAVGQEGFEKFNGPLWREAAHGAKDFAAQFGLPTQNAADIEAVMHLMATAAMGPEFKFNVVESSADRCVGTTTECPWHKRWKEQGLTMDACGAGHQAWGDGVAEALNPNYTFKLTKNMLKGDSHCEWVVEKKK